MSRTDLVVIPTASAHDTLTSMSLAPRRMPENICAYLPHDGMSDWVARLCDYCETSGNRSWHDLCWQDDIHQWSDPRDNGWDRLRNADYPTECVDPRLKVVSPPGMNQDRLPRYPGTWHVHQHFRCPLGTRCQQMVDDELDAHVFCIALSRQWPQGWAVDAFGWYMEVDVAAIRSFYWFPGEHHDQSSDDDGNEDGSDRPSQRTGRGRRPRGRISHSVQVTLDRPVHHGSFSARVVDVDRGGKQTQPLLVESLTATVQDSTAGAHQDRLCSTGESSLGLFASTCFTRAVREYAKGVVVKLDLVLDLALLLSATTATLGLSIGIADLNKRV